MLGLEEADSVRKPVCQASRTVLDLDRVSNGLYLTFQQTRELFSNVRFTTWVAARWAETRVVDPPTGRPDVVRCFNESAIRFQTARRVGTKRSCTISELAEDVKEVDRYIVVDVREFPQLTFYPIPGKIVTRQIVRGELSTNGLQPDEFEPWVKRNFDLVMLDVGWTVYDNDRSWLRRVAR